MSSAVIFFAETHHESRWPQFPRRGDPTGRNSPISGGDPGNPTRPGKKKSVAETLRSEPSSESEEPVDMERRVACCISSYRLSLSGLAACGPSSPQVARGNPVHVSTQCSGAPWYVSNLQIRNCYASGCKNCVVTGYVFVYAMYDTKVTR